MLEHTDLMGPHNASNMPRSLGSAGDTTPPTALDGEWVCPGVPYRRRVLTGAGVTLAAALFFFLAVWQGASMLASTLIGIVFIGGFVGYLLLAAPAPFTVTVDAAGVRRATRGGPAVDVPWSSVARIKEERFPAGEPLSLTVYKRSGERGVYRAFVVYGDDVTHFDTLLRAVRARMPEDRPWHVERVHE
jgi:hypothetical protein